MFGSSYWYVGPAPDGRRFCWAKSPTYTCPISDAAYEARRPEAEPSAQLVAAAEALGVELRWLVGVVGRGSHGRERVDGKLTERCRCGVRMKRLGFATWEERPDTGRGTGQEITRALGGEPTEQLGPRRYQDTKREAEAWARRQLKQAKGA